MCEVMCEYSEEKLNLLKKIEKLEKQLKELKLEDKNKYSLNGVLEELYYNFKITWSLDVDGQFMFEDKPNYKIIDFGTWFQVVFDDGKTYSFNDKTSVVENYQEDGYVSYTINGVLFEFDLEAPE